MAKADAFLFLSLLLLLSISSQSRLLPVTFSNSNLISDGICHEPPLLFLPSSPSFETCKQTYGFLPCSTTFWGNLFLMLLYGYLTFIAAKYISSGSEHLLQKKLGSSLVGGLFLPILDAFPNAFIILVSGLSESKETAQKKLQTGMGSLAGSTIMLLTLLWGSCVVVGKCDLVNSTSIDFQDSKWCSPTGSGVTTDKPTRDTAKIMTISVIPFIIVQLPRVFRMSSGSRIAILISLIVAVALLISYCVFQVRQPRIQRRVEYVELKHKMSELLRRVHKTAIGKLLDENGKLNEHVIEQLFHKLDLNHDGYVSSQELTALIIGIDSLNIDLGKEDAVNKVIMDYFDTSGDRLIDSKEFFSGISRWLEAKRSVVHGSSTLKKLVDDFHLKTGYKYYEMASDAENPSRVFIKDGLMLLLGTVIAAVFADPLVDSVTNFSYATNIPPFFISFIAMPLATSSGEAFSSIISASRKNKDYTSLTFSEIYGGVTMNNLLCLAVFLALVYVRHLTWDFSAEVLVILIVCIVMGLFTGFSMITFPLWTCSIAFSLYALSLVLVYVLDYVLKWS